MENNVGDLKRLADEMAGAYKDRVQSINAIKQETADFLNASSAAHQEMAAELRANLAKSKHDLEVAESERKAADQAEIKDREIYIENMLADFDNAHQDMSEQLRAELAKVRPELMSGESERKAADQAEIKDREIYIENMLADFDHAHQEMSDQLRADLAKAKSDIISGESERKAADQNEIKDREIHIENMLADFDSAHQEMADQLRADLAKAKSDIISGESERKTADQAEIRERKWAVSSMLEEFGKAQAETAAAWKGLLAKMQSLRGQVPIAEMAEGKAAVETKTAEEDIGEETLEDEKEELKEDVLDLLGDHPDGLKMVALADMLGIESWRSLIPIMRDLLDEGEITKENSTYYLT